MKGVAPVDRALDAGLRAVEQRADVLTEEVGRLTVGAGTVKNTEEGRVDLVLLQIGKVRDAKLLELGPALDLGLVGMIVRVQDLSVPDHVIDD